MKHPIKYTVRKFAIAIFLSIATVYFNGCNNLNEILPTGKINKENLLLKPLVEQAVDALNTTIKQKLTKSARKTPIFGQASQKKIYALEDKQNHFQVILPNTVTFSHLNQKFNSKSYKSRLFNTKLVSKVDFEKKKTGFCT